MFADNYTISEVVSSNKLNHQSVQCIEKDSTGFLWIGTKDGLNRYDGYKYVSYKYDPQNKNSISSNEVSCLAVQGDSVLWIGTRGGGVNKLGLKDGIINRYSYESYNGFIRGISVDKNGSVWVGTSVGLLKYDIIKDDFVNVTEGAVYRRVTNESYIPTELNKGVQTIYPYTNNSLIVGADGGLYQFHIKSGDFRELSSELTYNLSVTSNITEDKEGNLWVANYGGLIKLQPEKNKNSFLVTKYNSGNDKPYYIKANRVDDVVVDKNSNVWFTVEGVGLAVLQGERIFYFEDLIPEETTEELNIINDLLYDEHGQLWIGSDSQGLHALGLSESHFNILKTASKGSLEKISQARSIAGRNDKLYVGTLSGKIEQFKIEDQQLIYQKTIDLKYEGQDWKNIVKALLIDSRDNIWAGSSVNSLIKYQPDKNFKYFTTDGYVFTIMEDNHRNIWYGTWGHGFGYVSASSGNIEMYAGSKRDMLGLSNNIVLSMAETSSGYLLIGTKGGGLNVALSDNVIKRSGKFHVYRHKPDVANSIAHNDIFKVVETKKGDIWLGTGRGLVKIVPSEGESLEESLSKGSLKFIEITEKDGLPGGIVNSINEDINGDLWLGTSRGICRYSEKDNVIIDFYPEGDDINSSYENNAVYYDFKSNYMFLGGINGVVYYNPDSIIPKKENLPVYLTDFTILNEKVLPGREYNGRVILEKDIAYTKSINLKHKEKLFSIEFSSLLNKSVNNKTRYKYRLLGFNDNWIEVSDQERKITFSNLRAGSYDLQIRASNRDGTWSDKTTLLEVDIQPPLWLTPWAYALYLIVLLLMLLAYRKYSLIRIKEKNQLHIQELEHRKEVEISDAKIRFFTNVSHEIRTPLTLIYEPLKQLHGNKDLSDEPKELAGMVMRNMKRLLNQVNRLLELRKMDDGEYVIKYSDIQAKRLLTRIMYEFEVAVKSKNITVKYNIPDNIHFKADRQLLDTVIYNLISNAIKFLPQEAGLLELEVATNKEDSVVEEGNIRISVADNGPGIEGDEINKVFDYFYQTKGVVQSDIGGTGIGLAIVKEYIDYHKGTVSVKNLERGGCQFDILLPANIENKETESDVITKETSTETIISSNSYSGYLNDITNGVTLSMVIVEDDIDLANYLKGVFKIRFKVTHFPDGMSALDSIAEIMPDIVITDLMMPKLNGMELTEKLRQNQETSHIPIVMLTAKSEDESRIKGLKYGADSYLIKPFNTEVLVAQVGAIIKSRKLFKERFSKDLVLEPTESVIVPAEEKFIKKIMELTESRLDDHTFEVPDIVNEMGMSHSLLLRKFKAITGMSLVEFIRSMRIKKAEQLFKQDKFTVAEVAYQVGFSDPKYFSKCFANQVGERPSVYIKKHHM